MKLAKQKIGMWGLGIVGWSILKYLATQKINFQANLNNLKSSNFDLIVFEQRELSPEELAQLAILGVSQATKLADFLNFTDIVIPSPGVDLRDYKAYKHKFYSELDLFAANFHKPILAITGSLGKTTITTVLAELLTKLNLRVAVGGNIGVGMCDLIDQQANLDLVVLELSSFQLEQVQNFCAQGALWTNFCANHLDRHNNLTEYFKAKLRLFELQEAAGISLLPNELLDNLELLNLDKIKSKLNFFGSEKFSGLINLGIINNLYYVRADFIVREQAGRVTNLIRVAELDASILLINWVAIVGFLDLVNNNLLSVSKPSVPVSEVNNLINILRDYKFAGIEHRVEFFAEINGVKFYNDSKSTVPEATLAALNCLTNKVATSPIILILGGLGKGVKRDKFISELIKYKNLKQVIIFGGEAQVLKKWCDLHNLNSLVCADLSDIVAHVWEIAEPSDNVLFSPSGSSYDLFKNYMVRGQEFKKLVLNN